MNIHQLEYIIAVDTHRHFARAAEACNITQPTLSTMIQKMEDELGTVLFDRSKQPIIPTVMGKLIIEQAKSVLKEFELLTEIAGDTQKIIQGELKVGIIQTLAPYLLPFFLPAFMKKYPGLKLKITELNTNQICEHLRRNLLDVGILATPLHEDGIKEDVLFYEELMVYDYAPKSKNANYRPSATEIDPNRLWLLEDGHCLKTQVLNLCDLRNKTIGKVNLEYAAGSVESLIRIVEMNGGVTILPELAVLYLSPARKKHLMHFKAPVPVREISLVTHRHNIMKPVLAKLKEEIIAGVSKQLKNAGASQERVDVTL